MIHAVVCAHHNETNSEVLTADTVQVRVEGLVQESHDLHIPGRRSSVSCRGPSADGKRPARAGGVLYASDAGFTEFLERQGPSLQVPCH